MAEDMGSLDCPDCQLQLLQQQSQASTTDLPDNHQVHQIAHEIINRNPAETLSLWTEGRSKPMSTLSQEMIPGHYQLGHSMGNASRMSNSSSSSNCLNIYSYSSDAGNFHNAPSTSLPNTSVGMSTASSTTSVSDMTAASAPIEPCDYNNGYCSTCAVLELPTNEKFYRPTNSRPHVFPPIFYTQGASSVIPCFSPIPDCPWGNEYNLYGYSAPYSQSTSTNSVSNEYYGSSNVITNSSSILSSDPSNITNLQPLNTVPYSVSSSYNTIATTRSDCRMEPGPTGSEPRPISKPTPEPLPKEECSTGNGISISNQSPSSSEEDTDSSCGSESSDSILSEDRELISVVEDDENDSVKELGDNFSTTERSNNKCWICHHPLGMTVCSSPQLAKILENIDGEITAEDLDISVSSGDIEIGGIDDEMKDFHHKKEHSTSQADISISRLSSLIGISPQNMLNCESQRVQQPDSNLACLCFQCGKLVSLADSLERQLTATVNKLHQQLHLIQNLTTLTPHSRLFGGDDNVPASFPVNRRHEYVDKATQIGDEISLELILAHQTESPTQNANTEKVVNTSESLPKNIPEDNSAAGNGAECSPSDNDEVLSVSSMSSTDNNLMPTDPDDKKEKLMLECTNCLEGANHLAQPQLTNACSSCEETETMENCSFSIPNESNNIIESKTPTERLFDPNLNPTQSEIKILDEIFDTNTLAPSITHLSKNDSQALSLRNPAIISESVPKKSLKAQINCNHCQRKFSTKSNLTAHYNICKFKTPHQPSDELKVDKMAMKCTNCGIGFRSTVRRRMHLDQGCKTIVFECEYCSKRFSKNSELKVHLLLHQGGKDFKCDICGASFSTKGNQVAHSRTHSSGKAYPCTLCDKGFNRRYALLMHMNRHIGVKPFSCTICKKGFSDPSNLKNHTKRSHRQMKQLKKSEYSHLRTNQ